MTDVRAAAAASAAAIRAWLVNPALAGERTAAFIDFARPRRGALVELWSGLPGLMRTGAAYTHILLPGWEYTAEEMRTEMIEDLARLAETGERPKVATRR